MGWRTGQVHDVERLCNMCIMFLKEKDLALQQKLHVELPIEHHITSNNKIKMFDPAA